MTVKLKPVGFYSDTDVGESDQVTLESSRGKFSGPVEQIVSYLQNAQIVMVSGIGVRDELAPGKPLIGELGIHTDGVWVWPSSYPYFVETYRAEVPAELLELASSRHWIPPVFPDDVDFDERMPFGD